MRARGLVAALAVLAAALIIAILASRPPAALPADAPASIFSAGRAMADVRAISRAPRPTGSAEIARVRAYLAARMRALGMTVEMQAGPLPGRSVEKLRERGRLEVAPSTAVNLIGVLPGRDPRAPAVLLMAHYDSVPFSPGAPDDAAGVAAALEVVRAVRARGVPHRNVAILLTDAEEAGLVGARMFFTGHPLARRTGVIINMEARGGGGRAAMFETGRGNGAMMEVYRRSVSRPAANSLAVLIYELMPNNTDFTIPKERGIAGFNFAFIGRPELYHSPMATADRFQSASLQDLGSQALELTGALAFAAALPPKAEDAVFGDVLGLFVIAYAPGVGWVLLALSAALFGLAWWRVRGQSSVGAVLGGAVRALAFLLHAALLLRVGNLVSGSGGETNYYDRLAALARLEVQAFLLCLAALLMLAATKVPGRRLLATVPPLLLMLVGFIAGGWSPILLALGTAAAVTGLLVPRGEPRLWSGWLGLAVLVMLLALAAQVAAPTAKPLLVWPLVMTSVAAAIVAAVDLELGRVRAPVPLALIAAVGAAQLLYLGHLTFLGVGAPVPEAMAVYLLLVALLVWPLVQGAAGARVMGVGAGVLVVVAVGLALSVRLDSMAATIPPYSDPR